MTRNRVLAGLIAGVTGGMVAGLLATPPQGWLFHLVVSAVLGLLFGLGFGARVRTAGTGLLWGQAYGVLWWVLGSLTLLPLVDGRGLRWSVAAIHAGSSQLLGRLLPFIPATANRSPAEPRVPDLVPPPIQALVVGGLGD